MPNFGNVVASLSPSTLVISRSLIIFKEGHGLPSVYGRKSSDIINILKHVLSLEKIRVEREKLKGHVLESKLDHVFTDPLKIIFLFLIILCTSIISLVVLVVSQFLQRTIRLFIAISLCFVT